MEQKSKMQELQEMYTKLCVAIGECKFKIAEMNEVIDGHIAKAKSVVKDFKLLADEQNKVVEKVQEQDDTKPTV